MDLSETRFTVHNLNDFQQPEDISEYFSLTGPLELNTMAQTSIRRYGLRPNGTHPSTRTIHVSRSDSHR